MVDAMRSHPEDRPAFEGHGAADGKQVFESQGHLVRAVRVQPVVAHADPQSGGEPQEEQGDRQVRPTEHEERRDGADMQKDQYQGGRPVQGLLGGGELDEVEGTGLLSGCGGHYAFKLAGNLSALCKSYVISDARWIAPAPLAEAVYAG